MSQISTELNEDVTQSILYSEDLAPVPAEKRTWNTLSLASIWVGMAVCIPTYLLASYMIKSGLGWVEALVIIFVANLIVTLPMILNGHAGVKYGIPFPVLGRASFGTVGVHVPSIVRGFVACGWFGIQTWIGGLAIYAIWCALLGVDMSSGLTFGKFVGFALFWLLNIVFILKGTESIKWLESFAAPILILMGIILIAWGAKSANGFAIVLAQADQLGKASATFNEDKSVVTLTPLVDVEGQPKANAFRLIAKQQDPGPWQTISSANQVVALADYGLTTGTEDLAIQFRAANGAESSHVTIVEAATAGGTQSRWMTYIFWLTAMVGFWATMSISIADITRYVNTQREQVMGQLIGLPGTMLLYSFVGVFVTCASLILFGDILIGDDAPWDPVTLLAKFKSPAVVITAQVFMLIATLSTNIAANVIAPANAFANAFPRRVSFRTGGVITGIIGILICPWWLLNEISGLLIFVSGLLGPVLGVLICDYYLVRKKHLELTELFKPSGIYSYLMGWNVAGIVSLGLGIIVALVGFWVPQLSILYTLSWFTGFAVAFIAYSLMMKKPLPSA